MPRKTKERGTYNESEHNTQSSTSLFDLHGDAKRSIAAIVLWLITVLCTLGFFNAAGVVGASMSAALGYVFGVGKWIAPIVFSTVGIILIARITPTVRAFKLAGLIVAFVGMLGLVHLGYGVDEFARRAQQGSGGGYTGYALAAGVVAATGAVAGAVVLIALVLVGIIVAFNISLIPFFTAPVAFLRGWQERRRSAVTDTVTQASSEEGTPGEDSDDGVMTDGETQSAVLLTDRTTTAETMNSAWSEVEDGLESEQDTHGGDRGGAAHPNVLNVRFGSREGRDGGDSGGEQVHAAQSIAASNSAQAEPLEESRELHDAQPHRAQQREQKKKTPWVFTPLPLYEKGGTERALGAGSDIAKRIQQTLRDFGIAVDVAATIPGPTVTQYRFRPLPGVKVSKITALANDIALAIAAPAVRIEAPIPGEALIGIEVPNSAINMKTVRLQELFADARFGFATPGLTCALGKDVGGEMIYADIADMPHLLVAGATGAGKSVCIHAIVLSLLAKNSPRDVRFLFIDPKRVELTAYSELPHLLSPVIVDHKKAVTTLRWALAEMERRYALFEKARVRNRAAYNEAVDAQRGSEDLHLPAIVIIIDELADLMVAHQKEIEPAIVRLAQMARAVGIHLILSTQRPSVEVITGLIKANIPTRIALRVATQIDSRTIIDAAGAERLVGKGDLLYSAAHLSKPQRIQCPYVSDKEITTIVRYLIDENPSYRNSSEDDGMEGVLGSTGDVITSGSDSANDHDDPLYNEARHLVIDTQKASTSFLQRRLRLGYGRAARLLDLLEEEGVVSPATGPMKARDVLIGREEPPAAL